MLGWFPIPPHERRDTYERSRNLFYVACSRPKKNLAILFTQLLSPSALATLNSWFGEENIITLRAILPTLN
jgi:DNA helicase-2/ATP-dependent DNA helicase PcrA